MQALRTIYRYWVGLVFLAVVVQVGAAAYGGFYSARKLDAQKGADTSRLVSQKVFDHGFGFHTAFGYLIFLASIVLLLLALGARLGRKRVLLTLAVPVAVIVQIVLAWIGGGAVAAIGFLHGINALVIFGLTGSLAAQAWRSTRTAAPETATA